jgi:hypothetical protein
VLLRRTRRASSACVARSAAGFGTFTAKMRSDAQTQAALSLSNDSTYAGFIGGLTGAAAQAVVGVGLQWNTMSHVGELASRGYLVMQTEHCCGNYPFTVAGTPAFNPDKPPNDHAYAVESWGYIRDWIKAGVNVYSAWNMVLDTVGKNPSACPCNPEAHPRPGISRDRTRRASSSYPSSSRRRTPSSSAIRSAIHAATTMAAISAVVGWVGWTMVLPRAATTPVTATRARIAA